MNSRNRLGCALLCICALITLATVKGIAMQQAGRLGNPYTDLLLGPPLTYGEACHAVAGECLTTCSNRTPVQYWSDCRARCGQQLATCRQGRFALYKRQQRRLDSLYEKGITIHNHRHCDHPSHERRRP